MATDEILRLVFVGGLILLPVVCAGLTVFRIVRGRPRWPGYVCLGAFIAGAAGSIPLAQHAAANAVDDPARWWAVAGLVATSCGSVAAWVALLATRRWTQESGFSQTVIGLWIIAVLLIGSAFLGPNRNGQPVVVPIKTKRG